MNAGLPQKGANIAHEYVSRQRASGSWAVIPPFPTVSLCLFSVRAGDEQTWQLDDWDWNPELLSASRKPAKEQQQLNGQAARMLDGLPGGFTANCSGAAPCSFTMPEPAAGYLNRNEVCLFYDAWRGCGRSS